MYYDIQELMIRVVENTDLTYDDVLGKEAEFITAVNAGKAKSLAVFLKSKVNGEIPSTDECYLAYLNGITESFRELTK